MSNHGQDSSLMQIPPSLLAAIQTAVAAERNDAEAAMLFRQAGLATGGAVHDAFRAWLASSGTIVSAPEDLASEEFWKRLGDFFEQMGWGRLEYDSPHPGIIELSSADWAEGSGGATGRPTCHLSTGIIAELLRRIAGEDLAVLEVECRSAGADRCRFLIGAAPTLEALFGHLQDGAGYAEAVQSLS
ncbi:MAG: V4R domain-containing protein [Gemmatimonadota bacterium]